MVRKYWRLGIDRAKSGIYRTEVGDPAAVDGGGGSPRWPGIGPSAFVNGSNDVDGPRQLRQLLEGRAKSGIYRTGVGQPAAVGGGHRWLGGGPNVLVNGRNNIDQTVDKGRAKPGISRAVIDITYPTQGCPQSLTLHTLVHP
jgi:hypothetical protein